MSVLDQTLTKSHPTAAPQAYEPSLRLQAPLRRGIRRRATLRVRASEPSGPLFFARGEKSRGGGLSGPLFLQKVGEGLSYTPRV